MIERRLLRLDRRATALLAAVVLAGGLATALLAVQTGLLAVAVQRVFLGGQGLDAALPLLAVAAGALLARSVAAGLGDVLAQRASTRIKTALRQGLGAALFASGPVAAHAERAGELVNTLGDGVEALDPYLTQYLPARYGAAANTLLIFLAVLLLDPPTTLVLLFAGPMLVLLLALIGGQAQRLAQQRFAELSWMSAFFLDLLQGLPTLKLFGRSREQAATIERISLRYGEATLHVLATAFQSSLVMEWAATAATAMVALEVSLRLVAGTISFAPALAVLLLTPEFFLPLRQMAIRYHAGAAGKAASERIFALLDAGERGVREAPATGKTSFPEAPFSVRFEGVTCSYLQAGGEETQRLPALNNVSFMLPGGKTTALVGSSGAGKSTVANLLLHFLEPDSGAIYVGDTPLASIDPAAWRQKVAWAPQQPHLFAGTAEENIRLGRPQASRQEVVAAARAAHAHGFISALPQGYDTPLGEWAARLSGGERRRLAIARAMLKDAPLLILDEAGANLDAESEALIADALARLMAGRTVLVIAHHAQLAAAADCVIVLDGGRVVEGGAPDALPAGGRAQAQSGATGA